MNSTAAESSGLGAVLHITAAAGGGADRYIRDLAASTPHRHYAWHVGAGPTVAEDISARRFAPIANLGAAGGDREALSRWLELAGIGIVHVHGVDEGCRAHLDTLLRARLLPYLVTLHDLQFVNPRAFETDGMPEPDADWIVAIGPLLERAATVIAPSEFILNIAIVCSPGIRATVIPPGVRLPSMRATLQTPADFAARTPKRVIAVVGAVGPHKGSSVLTGLATALENSDIGIVVIGYTDTRIVPGWVVPGVLYVHGAYEDGTLPAWLSAYRVDAVLFPNRLPESFSYTLSEVWAAGVPVVVPDQGALGERVEREGGGWLLPAGFDGDDAAALLVWLSSAEGAAERARVKSPIVPNDPRRVPTLEAMSRDIDVLYARFGLPPPAAADAAAANEALAPLLAANLDGFAFRKELVKLTGELGDATRQLAESRAWGEKLERDGAAWAAKLESDIAELKREIERLGADNRVLAERKAAFDLLPQSIQRYLLRRAIRARP
ncbi:MAG TPA: glycosyltransferase [Casimicrobiaceae bacterium]|nr:glycosyltransferase [Casimicrobiaceae bacterium]